MQRTINVQIPYDKDIVDTLSLSLKAYNEACRIGFEYREKNKNRLNAIFYHSFRDANPELPSDLVQQQMRRACESLSAVKFHHCPIGRTLYARYTKNTCTYFQSTDTMSVSTIHGRKKFHIKLPDWAKKRYSDWSFSNIGISYKKKRLTVHFVIEKDTPVPTGDKILGLDRGIINIVTCSDNRFYNSKHLKNVKGKYQFLKSTLQSIGTRSAKRHLKKLAERETRFVKDVNHCISKEIANSDYDVFVLEDLSKIKQHPHNKKMRKMLGEWSYYDLQTKLEYKAEALGKSVIYVSPSYTSQRCSRCGHTTKANRKGSVFKCTDCGFELNADLNASRNIARKGRLSLAGRIQPSECDDVATSVAIPQPRAGGS